MTLSRESLRGWATAPEVSRELRRLLTAAPAGSVAVVLLSGAFAPEMIPASAWRAVEGLRVAVVDLQLARDLATGRGSPSAADALSQSPPARGAWCLALAADGSALTWSTPITFTHSQGDA